MNAWRFGLAVGFAVCGSVVSHAQPSLELGQAIDRLFRAGNYSWEQRRSFDLASGGKGSRASRPMAEAEGQTEIGGYTQATVLRRQMIFSDTETIYLLSGGWKHSHDLSEEEMAELHFPTGKASHPLARRLSGRNRTLPHELIRTLFQNARNLRREQTAIIGDIAWTTLEAAAFHAFVEGGNGVFSGTPPPPFSPDSSGNLPTVGFIAWLEGGEISEFSIEFRSAPSPSANTTRKGTPLTIELYTTKLSLIGKTKFEIDPEARALFLERGGKR